MANLISNNTFFTEKELLDDLLLSEKQVASAYNTGITESTCSDLRKTLNKCLTNAQNCQYDIFNVMKQRGWYQIKEADSKDVETAKKKYSEILNDLS